MPLKEFTAKHFLGRSREMGLLKKTALLAGSGDSNSIVLSGKRGMGKTQLLKHLFSEIFNGQSTTIPFLYTVNTAFDSVEKFSQDYLYTFILHSLAFIKKDPSLINSGMYSLEDLREIANTSEASWAVDIINNYFHLRERDDRTKLFAFTVSVPSQCYRMTGRAVVVLIDDFHKLRRISELNADGHAKDLWMCFENTINYQYAPHILAGFQADLHKMFFEETSFGEHLEVIDLPGLDRDYAFGLFEELCQRYSLGFEAELTNYINLFGGNPFNIKSFVQAARHRTSNLTKDNFWEIYIDEITKGKIYTYWTSILKSYVQRFELRRPSLHLLFELSKKGTDDVSGLQEMLSVTQENIDAILKLLHTSGMVETGFSALEFVDDQVLIDLINGLYRREAAKEPLDRIKDSLMANKRKHLMIAKPPAFDITIPDAPDAELVAVKSLENIARHFSLPKDAIGQLQVSLVELFSGVLAKGRVAGESCQLTFMLKNNIFSVEIVTPRRDLVLTDDTIGQIRNYIDTITREDTEKGSKIILTKGLKEDFSQSSN